MAARDARTPPPECWVCGRQFGFFYRKYHCGICFRSVCSDCCRKVVLDKVPSRSCVKCDAKQTVASKVDYFKPVAVGGRWSFKLCLFGDCGTGKSGFVQWFLHGKADPRMDHWGSTIGAAFLKKDILYLDEPCVLEIWDTGGQDRYRTLAPMYYRGAAGAIVIYSITNGPSFAQARTWLAAIRKDVPECALVLVGNKCDQEKLRQVSTEQGKQLAQEFNVRFLETSALTGQNVVKTFNGLMDDVFSPVDFSMLLANFLRYLSPAASASLPKSSNAKNFWELPIPLQNLVVDYVGKFQLLLWDMHKH